ncbi:unnamed protein product [Wuchereria bancrofti]|uniref:EB domain-containing protein n=1 Tax=Wuchereria bancrofti TaxID=6293 RepID=A0A3P7EDT0_WUCBA|nr:unnamed protein product [Wuchereria bancrofti]
MFTFLILLTYIVNDTFGKLCPPIFGQFECPLNFTCVINECYSDNNVTAPLDCEQVKCDATFRCYKGRCYSTTGLPCDRNVQLSEHQSKSITSNCGLKGRCINGRCAEDKCFGANCTTDELCGDGKCLTVSSTFCITHFDCGPTFKCYQNKCIPFKRNSISCNCDPGEVCQKGRCCAHVSCQPGSFCLQGTCQSAIGQDCTSTVCQGDTICVEGQCILDPCTNRCPPDHVCREGQCRHLQGLLCYRECPKPYVCIGGRCTKNECFGKICQLGEMCQSGLCIKVEGRLCNLAIRDCAEEFECIGNTCRDLLLVKANTTLP